MKIFISILMMVILCNPTAFGSNSSEKKEFTLKYSFEGQNLEVREFSDSYIEAMESAAFKCLNHFKRASNYNNSELEDKGLRIIDACANPKR